MPHSSGKSSSKSSSKSTRIPADSLEITKTYFFKKNLYNHHYYKGEYNGKFKELHLNYPSYEEPFIYRFTNVHQMRETNPPFVRMIKKKSHEYYDHDPNEYVYFESLDALEKDNEITFKNSTARGGRRKRQHTRKSRR